MRNEDSSVNKIVVIGGGAAGLMAAYAALNHGAQVTVLEHTDKPGTKLLLTGNGSCNFTNSEMLPEHYSGDRSFIESVLSMFGYEDTLGLFEGLGVQHTEKRYRFSDARYIYPLSGEAASIRNALLYGIERLNGRVVTGVNTESISVNDKHSLSEPDTAGRSSLSCFAADDDGVSEAAAEQSYVKGKCLRRFSIFTDKGTFEADELIIAAGSNAAPETGSDSSVYPLIRQLGHGFKTFTPALCALHSADCALALLKGIRHDCTVTLEAEDAGSFTQRGEVQFNSNNISGIPVMNFSRYAAALKNGCRLTLTVDFLPDLSFDETVGMIKRCAVLSGESGRNFEDMLKLSLPSGLAKVVCKAVIGEAKAGTFTAGFSEELSDGVYLPVKSRGAANETCARIAALLKGMRFSINGSAKFSRAQTCAGGVPTDEIDKESMESKLCKGLYFAGELIDVDGDCGGYNLQWAWSTGFIAGSSAAG